MRNTRVRLSFEKIQSPPEYHWGVWSVQVLPKTDEGAGLISSTEIALTSTPRSGLYRYEAVLGALCDGRCATQFGKDHSREG